MATLALKPGTKNSKVAKATRRPAAKVSRRIGDALLMAEEEGLLAGRRTLTIRGRMPSRLVEEAKKRSGITSDSELIEAGLAKLVTEDRYMEWLLSRQGTVSKDLNLEF